MSARAAESSSSGESYREIDVGDAGSIKGQVVWKGDVPQEASMEVPVPIPRQPGCKCRKVNVDRLRIDKETKGVADCVISIRRIDAGKKLPEPGVNLATGEPAVLDQVQCRYDPHVMIVPVRTELTITSSDNTPHNVNARMGVEQRFNLQIARKGAKEHGPNTSVGAAPGVISLHCNAGHPWMSGYIHVVDHPYHALTDEKGQFELKDVPPGRYELGCWHADWSPKLIKDAGGAVSEVQYARPVELSEKVEVEANKAAEVEFELTAKAAETDKRPRRRIDD